MRTSLLISVAAAALIAGSGLAAAQGKFEGASPAPSAQQNAPAEKLAPTHNNTPGHVTNKNAQSLKQSRPAETTGQAQQHETEPGERPKMDRGQPGAKPFAGDQKGTGPAMHQRSEQPRGTTTGQGAASTHANISGEQRTRIRTVIKEKAHAQPLGHVDFSISIGTRVPRTVHYYPLPREVVEIYPAWRGYDFIMVGDQIVVIDPRTFEIVAVLDA